MIPEPRKASPSEVPILDLGGMETPQGRAELAAQLRKACLGLGFFYVQNHGVPKTLNDGIFEATKRFFALPLEERMKIEIDPTYRRGYMPQGITKSRESGKADLKESYEISVDLPEDDPDVVLGRFLHGPNRWPADHPWLQEAAEPYFDATMELAKKLLRIFALSLDLREEAFSEMCTKPMMHMRLLHYPPQQADTDDDAFGAHPHTDYGMMTILNQDPIGGLELRTRDGEWVAAPHIENTFVVNVGDLFKMWTNDLYVSTPHRVLNRTGRERFSIPTFLSLDYDTIISCLPSCIGDGAKYPPIKSGDYLTERLTGVTTGA